MKSKLFFLLIILMFMGYQSAETGTIFYPKQINFKNVHHFSDKNNSNKDIKLNSTSLSLLADKIHEYYEKMFHQKVFNGCVLVAIGDKIIYENAHGYNDVKQKTCLSTSHVFQLASVSKIFTSIAILKLCEKQLLNINDDVKKYFPEWPYEHVTIKHLLNHTSGLPNYLHLMPDIGRTDTILSHYSVLQFLLKRKIRPEFKPGRRHKYCNTNYAVLACLIEKVSGMSYSDFLKKEIFIPCNMYNTNTIHYVDIFDENTTMSNEYKSRNIPFYAGDFILGDKSIYSNIHDLFNFSQCFLSGKVISDSLMRQMISGVKTNRYGMLYGYGMRIKDYQDSSKTIWFHNGWWHGYRTSFQMRPKDKITVIVLSNHIYKTTYYTHPVFEIIDEVLNSNKSHAPNQPIYPSLDEE
ncbi:MAG: beta-lactamase family protein [Bacteroidia bacterium]|nr:beta-lactamase family protein [Bacteroidia bacterium]